MSGMNDPGYLPGMTWCHRMDPRVKLLMGLALTFFLWRMDGTATALVSLVALLALVRAGVTLSALKRDLGFLFWLLALVIASRSLNLPGPPVSPWLPDCVSAPGMADGLLAAGRILTVSLLGCLLVATTRSGEIRAAVAWFLEPVPGVPAGRVATMISLLVRFLPLILRRFHETRAAQAARGADLVKNPVRRMALLVIPVLRRVLLDADHLVLAMEARCYTEDRVEPGFRPSFRDAAALTAATLVLCVTFLLP